MRTQPTVVAALLLGVCTCLVVKHGRAQEHDKTPPQTTPARFQAAQEVLEDAIESGAFPGCAFAVGNKTKVVWQGGLGKFTYDDKVAEELGFPKNPRPNEQTIYDLASLTKVVATTSVLEVLVDSRKLSLDDPVVRWLPEFAEGEDAQLRQNVLLKHFLVHAAGLPSWIPFYRESNDYSSLLARASTAPLQAEPGSRYVYSDIGLILLGEIATRAGGAPLAELEQTLIFGPLGMDSTTRELTSEQRLATPPTEFDSELGQYVHGVVHDENSRISGGQTGHAGLFSNARDLARFATEYLLALEGKGRVFPQRLATQFTRRQELIAGSSRALGWDTATGRNSAGNRMSPRAFGHTGFTGTSIWIDPEHEIYLILLTNRVHPTRDNQQIGRVRRDFADAVLVAFSDH